MDNVVNYKDELEKLVTLMKKGEATEEQVKKYIKLREWLVNEMDENIVKGMC